MKKSETKSKSKPKQAIVATSLNADSAEALFEEGLPEFLTIVTKEKIKALQRIIEEKASNNPELADNMFWADAKFSESKKKEKALIQLELLTKDKENLLPTLLLQLSRFYMKYESFASQYVIYVGSDTPNIQTEEGSKDSNFWFKINLIVLNEIPAEEFLKAQNASIIPFSLLAKSDNFAETLDTAFSEIESRKVNTGVFETLCRSLFVYSIMRNQREVFDSRLGKKLQGSLFFLPAPSSTPSA